DELEAGADTFAAYLLMPLEDFRRQIPADADPTLDDLSSAAERYGVSLIACVLRWLEYTTRCSMLVISRDGFILWARASEPAFMSGLFIRSKNVAPVEVPSASLLGRADLADVGREGVDHPPGVWFSENCHEITIHLDCDRHGRHRARPQTGSRRRGAPRPRPHGPGLPRRMS